MEQRNIFQLNNIFYIIKSIKLIITYFNFFAQNKKKNIKKNNIINY